jgi:outer membrane protein
MRSGTTLAALIFGAALTVVSGRAQSPQSLSLKEAEGIALQNHPRISVAQLRALAADQVTTEIRSTYFPQIYGSMTGVVADYDSRITAGALNNPIIYSRYADGLTMSQFITDFGRTARLSESSRLGARAQQENVQATQAEVILEVDRLYFSALRARAVLEVARQTVQARQLLVDQVTALANSKLKSALDVSFAKVNLSDAQLLVVKAENDVHASDAQLSAALGYREQREFKLADEPLPPAPPGNESQLVDQALRDRPDLLDLRLEHESSVEFAKAEQDLWHPTISSLWTAGLTPAHVSNLADHYAAAGVNINFPIFNGHLFGARRAEADFKAQAARESVRDGENRVARDVRLALLNANTAYQRLELTAELLRQAAQALELAQARYNLGLGSIVELSQAQLNNTAAQIEQSSAKYEYQIQREVLDYQIGLVH